MSTSISIRHVLPVDEDTYWSKMFNDADYNRRLYLEGLGFVRYEPVSSTTEADGTVVRKLSMEPKNDAPAVVQKIAGSLAYEENGRYSPSERVYRFDITPARLADKVKVRGSIRVEKRGDREIQRIVDVEFDVKMFGVGSVLEGFIEKTNRDNWEKNAVFSKKFISEKGLLRTGPARRGRRILVSIGIMTPPRRPLLTSSLVSRAAFAACLFSVSACFDSSWFQAKSSQQSVAQARTPQGLQATPSNGDAPPPVLANVKTMRVRVHATSRHIAEITDWQRRFSEVLEDANRVLVPTLSIRLEVETATEWSPRTPDDALSAQLDELGNADPGDDVDWVIGLTGSVPRFEESFHELGMAKMPGKHAVLRAINDARELEAIEKGFPDLAAAERTKLFLARKRHKRATVLLHEIGHTLGSPHQPDRRLVMTPRYDIAVESYGPAATELLRVNADDRRASPAERDPRAVAEASIRTLRRWTDTWVPTERDDAIRRLQEQLATTTPRRPAPATTAAPMPVTPDTGLDAMTPQHRAAYDRANALPAGREGEAWAEATPLFEAYPTVPAVQDLRCRLAMKLRSWSEAKKDCAALVPTVKKRR